MSEPVIRSIRASAAARARLSFPPLEAARALIGATITVGKVSALIVETEAYGSPETGPWPDPAAHTYPGVTPRNAVMFGPAGHLYTYLSYGIHTCANVTAGPDGIGAGVLIRAAEIVSGLDVVATRRPAHQPADQFASGPGRFAQALGITLADNGIDVLSTAAAVQVTLAASPPGPLAEGPRIGLSKATETPWRVWLDGHPSVSGKQRRARHSRG